MLGIGSIFLIFWMSRFIDILEWCEATLKEAKKNKDVIWLIKSHPYDEWHGGCCP